MLVDAINHSKSAINRATFTQPCSKDMLSNELTKHHRNLSTCFSPKKGSANKKYYKVYLTAHSFNV